MTTVSEYLLIQIGIDVDKIKKDAKEAKRELTDLEKQKMKLVEAFKKGEEKVKSFFAVLAGSSSISAFIANIVGADAALNRLSKTTGMSVENISAWSNAAEHMGGSANEMQAGIAGISKELTKFKYTGDSTLIPFLNQMGVNILDNNGKMKDQAQIMLELADQAQKMPKEDFSNLASMNGFNQSQINLMLQGRKALEAQIKEQNKNNLVTKQQAEEAAKAEAAWVDLKQSFMGVARAVAYVLIPPLIGVAKVLTAMFTFVGNHKETLGVLFLFAIPKLLAFNKGFLILLRYMTGITPVLKLATFAMRGFGLASIIALAPLLLIGTGLGLLLDDFLTFQAGGDSWLPWDKIFGGAKEAITYIKDVVFSLDRLKDLLKALATGDWEMAKNIGKDIIGGLTPSAIAAGISKQQQQGGTPALQNGDYQVMTDDEIEAQKKKEAGQIDLKQIDDMAGRANEKIKSVASTAVTSAGNILFGSRTGNTLNLSQQDILDIKKTASTEVLHNLKGESLYNQTGGVVQTILNRRMSGYYGKSIRDVVNAKNQFSKINGPQGYRDKSGQWHDLNPYHGVQNMPESAINPNVAAAVDKYLVDIANGKQSIIGGHLSYLNPKASSANAMKQWGNEVVSQGIYFSGHYHGTPSVDKRKMPKAFSVSLSNGKGSVTNQGGNNISTMNSSELANFASSSMPVGAKANHALKHSGNATHNTINSSTVIHKVNIVADKAEHAGKAFLQEMQKARELKNPWWKAAMANNTAMQ